MIATYDGGGGEWDAKWAGQWLGLLGGCANAPGTSTGVLIPVGCGAAAGVNRRVWQCCPPKDPGQLQT